MPKEGWPTGVYEGPPALRLHVVALSELPRTRDTLLLRLMGRSTTLKAAIEDLRALPDDAWERQRVLPWLVSLRIVVPAEGLRTSEEAMILNLRKMAEEYRQQTLAEGEARGIAPLARMFERKLGHALTPTDHSALWQKLDAIGSERLGDAVFDLPGDELARWLTDPNAR